MTNNEIIKALECMASVNENGLCYAEQENIKRMKEGKLCVVCGNIENETYECCPFYQVPLDTCMDDGCQQKALQLAIDLINRQKAEIERLEKAAKDFEECFHRMDSLYHIKCMELKVARAEAIKEFAKRLKESVEYIPWCDYAPVQRCIDDLVKEMERERE